MPRLPRKPTAPRPYGVGAVAAGWSRRRAAREPRVVVREASGQPATLSPSDPRAERLLDAAERLISAAQRASDGPPPPP
jgi:hypothetical protein